MCNIIWREQSVDFPSFTYLDEISDQNPHGFGAMWISDHGQLESFRSLQFNWHNYRALPDDRNILIHFRFATHGSISVDNTHPFIFEGKDGKYGLMHNGILSIKPRNDKWSDTRELAEGRLSVIAKHKGWRGVKKGIRRAANGDRIAVMRNDGTYRFFGGWYKDKKRGLWTSTPVSEWSGGFKRRFRFPNDEAEWWQKYEEMAGSAEEAQVLDEHPSFRDKQYWERETKKALEAPSKPAFSFEWANDCFWTEDDIETKRQELRNKGVSEESLLSMSMAELFQLESDIEDMIWEEENKTYVMKQEEKKGGFDEAGNWALPGDDYEPFFHY